MELVLLLYTLAICAGSMVVPPLTLPPSGILPPANLVDAVIIKHHVCLLPGDEETTVSFGCGLDTGVNALTVINSGVGGWSSVFENDTYCPVTNPECTASQLDRVLRCEFFGHSCIRPYYQIDIDVPGCTEPTNFLDVEFECPNERPKFACGWEGYSTAENLLVRATIDSFMCRCVIRTPAGSGLSTYVNITLVTARLYHHGVGNIFVQYDGEIQYETALVDGLRRISMVENLLLEPGRQLVLGINQDDTFPDVGDILFTFRATLETHMFCYDELIDMGSCSSSPCVNGGSCIRIPQGFVCHCTAGFIGQFCQIEMEDDPLIENVRPLYGPIAGGTLLTVTGQHFPVDASAVLLGTIQCPVINQSSTEIVSLTPEVEASVISMILPISVKFLEGLVVSSDQDYTYRNNPIIESIYPLTTIVHGGTKLTLSGEYLDSVYEPFLEVTMVIRETTENDDGDIITMETRTNYTEECDIGNDNSTELICYTPALDDVPDDILNQNNSKNCPRMNNPDGNIRMNDNKVPEPTHCISGTFYLGMALDGLNVYKNISEHPDISKYGTMKILTTPMFNNVRRVFEKDKMEIFEGDHLDFVDQSEYLVWIGSDDCQVLDVKANALTCLPSNNFPTVGSQMKDQAFDIIVFIGNNFNSTIGIMMKKPMLPFIIVGVVLAGVLIPLVIALAIYCTRKKRQTKKAQEDTSDDIIHLPDIPISDWSDNNLDQSSSITHNSMGYNNMAQFSGVQNNADIGISCHDHTRQPGNIRNKGCVTMDVPYEMAITPPPLPKREKIPIYQNVF